MRIVLPFVLAFGGGLVSFASPCVLPLVPAYVSVLGTFGVRNAGNDTAGNDTAGNDPASAVALVPSSGAIVRQTALFVAGFTTVFVLLGSGAGALGKSLLDNRLLLTRVGGAVVLAMALLLAMGQLSRAPLLQGEWRLHVQARKFGPVAAPVAGAAFGLGWTPCIGPVLASVLTVASTQGEVLRGALLLCAYSLGLGIPFMAGGLLLERWKGIQQPLRRHVRSIVLGSSALMACLGLLLVLGQLSVIDTAMGPVR